MMKKHLLYLWFVIVMGVTSFFPDWRPVMWFRGLLIRPCFKKCGRNFQICSGVTINSINNMVVGNNVYIAYGCWLHAIGGISLDDEVMLGPYTVVTSGNHTLENGSYRFGKPSREIVSIGFGSWTGAGTKVMPGIRIGKSSCCAAGCVVTKDVPDNSIVGGIPARLLQSKV